MKLSQHLGLALLKRHASSNQFLQQKLFELEHALRDDDRKIYRHSSDKGTVIEFDCYGRTMKLFVPDAKYRLSKKYEWARYDSKVENVYLTAPRVQMSNSTESQAPLLIVLSDSELQSEFPSFKADKTAKENTDILMQCGSKAAKACRDTDIGLGPMDLPNIYELMVIYQCSDILDSLDPTFEEFKDTGLGYKSTHGRMHLSMWSSSAYDERSGRCILFTGEVCISGMLNDSHVIPVLEI